MEWINPDAIALSGRYLHRGVDVTDAGHSASITALGSLLLHESDKLTTLDVNPAADPSVDLDPIGTPLEVATLRQAKLWIARNQQKSMAILRSLLEGLIATLNAALTYVRAHTDSVCDTKSLLAAWRRSSHQYAPLLTLGTRRHRLRAYVRARIVLSALGDAHSDPTPQLVTAASTYDRTTGFAPESLFDILLHNFLYADQMLSLMIGPSALVIAEPSPKAGLLVIGELNMTLVLKFGINSESARAVIFIALVRYLFGIAYTLSPALRLGAPAAKAAFPVACARFSQQTVRDLALCEAIARKYTPGLRISSMFSSRHVGLLRPMEFMTNPIDLLHHIEVVLQTLAAYFASAEEFVSFDDTITLFMALLSVNPPENAVGIAAFLETWERAVLSRTVMFAKNAFVASVKQILGFT
jgi:hypothetical protein